MSGLVPGNSYVLERPFLPSMIASVAATSFMIPWAFVSFISGTIFIIAAMSSFCVLALPSDGESLETLPTNPTNYKEAVTEFKKEYLEGILRANKGNKSATAREVEMDRTLNRLNINPQSFKRP